VGGDARQVHTPGGVFDEEQDVQAAQEHGIDMEEAGREDGFSLTAKKVRHVWPCRLGAGSMPASWGIFQTADGATV
jgi:hypothetical protein